MTGPGAAPASVGGLPAAEGRPGHAKEETRQGPSPIHNPNLEDDDWTFNKKIGSELGGEEEWWYSALGACTVLLRGDAIHPAPHHQGPYGQSPPEGGPKAAHATTCPPVMRRHSPTPLKLVVRGRLGDVTSVCHP